MPGYTNPQNLNRYSYVTNNPLRYTDPTGHYCVEEDGNGNIIRIDCDSSVPIDGGGIRGGGHHDDDDDYCSTHPASCGLPLPAPPVIQPPTPILSYFPPGPACWSTNYCYVPSYLQEPHPWIPDYLAIEGGVPVLWILGVDGVLVFDKYNRVYLGIGPSAGTSPALGLDFNISVSGGYIEDSDTLPGEAHSFISEWSGGGCLGAAIGYCRVTGDPFDGHNTWANQYGVFTPQAGVSLPYSWQITP